MAEIILHQYATSPFSEKIRKIFAHKKITWRSVEQPVIMPKPKLVPLTGGYRRIPVLQIGADVWCDTGIIVRKIEELNPTPSIYPEGLSAAADVTNQWADRRLFWSTTPVVFEKLAAGERNQLGLGHDHGLFDRAPCDFLVRKNLADFFGKRRSRILMQNYFRHDSLRAAELVLDP